MPLWQALHLPHLSACIANPYKTETYNLIAVSGEFRAYSCGMFLTIHPSCPILLNILFGAQGCQDPDRSAALFSGKRTGGMAGRPPCGLDRPLTPTMGEPTSPARPCYGPVFVSAARSQTRARLSPQPMKGKP